jgi:hypothetical protein
MSARTLPFVGIPCCVRSINERLFHTVNERYPNALVDAAGCLPARRSIWARCSTGSMACC